MRARLAGFVAGVAAIGTKELRGRMRGPRAFIALTFYLALLAGFVSMIYLLQRQAMATTAAFGGGGSPYVSAEIGQGTFVTLLLLQVLLVVFLAPAATSGAISLEREKQTLDLLAATPVSTFAIVVGKLVSALAFVVVLVLASIPLTAVVFVFGGVAPEDVARGYVVLLVSAIGFGSVGLLFSTLTRRTQSATVLTYLAVLVLTVGTGFGWFFWNQMAGPREPVATPFEGGAAVPAPAPRLLAADTAPAPDPTPSPAAPRPPEALLWLNPVIAAADVVCGSDVNPYSAACQLVAAITGRTAGVQQGPLVMPAKPGFGAGWAAAEPGVAVDVVGDAALAAPGDGSSTTRDTFWPKSAAAWLVTSIVLVLVSTQLVTPTRRWRGLPRRRRLERPPQDGAAA